MIAAKHLTSTLLPFILGDSNMTSSANNNCFLLTPREKT